MLSVGIDAALNRHQGEMRNDSGKVYWNYQIVNDRDGLEKLIDRIQEIEKMTGDKVIGIYAEAMGTYFAPFQYHLTQRGYRVVLVNPKKVKSARTLKNLNKNKSDVIDATTLASLPWMDEEFREKDTHQRHLISELTRLYQKMQRIETQLKNSLNSDLTRVFPEFLRFVNDRDSKTVLKLLEKYSTPAKILEVSEAKLLKLVRSASRCGFGSEFVKKVRELAKDTIGVPDIEGVLEYRIKYLIKRIWEIKESLKKIEKEINRRSKGNDEIQMLDDMRGIERIKAVSLYGEVGPIEQFQTARKLQGYGGITPKRSQSGKKEHIGRPTKVANHYLRNTISVCARSLAHHNEEFREIYYREKKKGKTDTQAYIIISNRLLYHIFTILKNKKPYRKRLPMSAFQHPRPSVSCKG
jgi:transposase